MSTPFPPTSASSADQLADITASNDGKSGPQKNPIPQALMDDMMMLRALNQYKNVGSASAPGSKLDITN
jgi:hypothetical protein